MTHWFPPHQLATKMSIWNTSHSCGSASVAIACGYIVTHFGWRWGFYIPAMVACAMAFVLLFVLRDTPSSVGLSEIKVTGSKDENKEQSSAEFKAFVRKKVFGNPYVWVICSSLFFLYIMRFAVLDWGPTMLKESKGVVLTKAGWILATFEISGLIGMLTAGWMTDRFFGGRIIRVCCVYMILASVFMFLFWRVESASMWVSIVLLGVTGFFLYGPQALIGIGLANIVTKRAAATAIGLSGIFAYASTIVSGWGLALVVQKYDWDTALIWLVVAGLCCAFLLGLAWRSKIHGYE